MARKGWEQLSPAYRRRLEKGGINRVRYDLGMSLHKARGHKSKREESQRRQFWRLADKQLSRDFDREEIQEVVDSIGYEEALEILRYRDMALHPSDAMEAYLSAASMRTLYGQYEGVVPREWLWYHGAK
jgi:hypothetical protein